MRKPEGSTRLFDSVLLEQLSRAHPLTPLLLWAPVIAWLLWRSLTVHGVPAGHVAGLGGAGLLAWTLTEYMIHRFLFHGGHGRPQSGRVRFILHGIHHENPNDRTRLLMPPVPAIVAHTTFYGLLRLVLDRAWAEPLFAFFLMGYLAYDYIHFALHLRRPRTRVGRYLRRWHLSHHFASSGARWGVSSPIWDYVFRTTAVERHAPGRLQTSR